MADLEGKIQIQSDLVPDNDNPRQPTTSVQYVKGATQNFGSLAELVAFHPNKMRQGMAARVVNIDLVSTRVFVNEYTLMVDPESILDSGKNSIVTENNYLKYWTLSNQTQTESQRVFEYSPDGANGTKPPYPYVENPSFETNWHSIALPSDRWVRFRDTDESVFVLGIKIYTGWTLPISIGQQDITGDYTDTRYKRQDVDTTIRNSVTGLINNKFYLVLTGDVTDETDSVLYTNGRTFKYLSAHTYSFSGTATVRETVETPPRKINGLDNNEPDGWFDGPPAGAEQLWAILAPKSVYGDLKGDWQLKKINENPDLIRYSEFASPNPNTIVGVNDPATTGSSGDTNLNLAGWLAVFQDNFKFIAERQELGGSPNYTEWSIRKISGESGEYKDRVFKLFDLNSDFDDVVTQKPISSDAISEGFSDVPLQETDTQINWVFECTKFFDGTLKGSWSDGIPYSAQDIFNDVISSDAGDNFKYNPNTDTPNIPVPDKLTLTADLYKGIKRISETSEITYVWERVYNNGAADSTVIISYSNVDALYLLASSGTPGDPGYMRDAQRLVVTPAGVSGKAIFKCTQTFVVPGGDNIVFEELITINDVTDGLDAKDLSIKADNQLVIYDNVNDEFAPAVINLNAFFSNLTDPIIYWYEFVGGVWVRLDPGDSSIAPDYVITETPFGSRLTINCDTVFDHDDDLQEFRYAASTDSTDPEAADSIVTFSDFVTIAKAAAAAVGTPGKNATVGILSNEYQNIILDDETLVPLAGEIGPTGKAQTILSVFDGPVNIPYGAGANKYTIALSSDNVDVTFGSNTVGLTNDVRVYVDTWTNSSRKASCTVTITYDNGTDTIVFIKKFTVGSTLDTPGALSVIIDSDAGFEFLPAERATPKNLTAQVYDTSKTPQLQDPADFYFNWTIGSITDPSYVKGGGMTNGEEKTVSRVQVLLSAFVTVRMAKVSSPGPSDIIRSVTIRINDIADGKLYRLFSAAVSAPAKPGSSVGPAGNGTWFPYLGVPVWAVDGYENPETNPVTYTWSDPYQISGEKGDQGNPGGIPIYLYKSSPNPSSTPAFGAGGNLSTIAQMVTAGWRSSAPGQLPTSGYIWQTQRLYKTTNSLGGLLTFDANGYPENGVPFDANSVWIAPQRLTPVPGATGGSGPQGVPGPQGIQGIQGPPGPAGGSGLKLYETLAYTSQNFNNSTFSGAGASGYSSTISLSDGYYLIDWDTVFADFPSGSIAGACICLGTLQIFKNGVAYDTIQSGTIYFDGLPGTPGIFNARGSQPFFLGAGNYTFQIIPFGRGSFQVVQTKMFVISV